MQRPTTLPLRCHLSRRFRGFERRPGLSAKWKLEIVVGSDVGISYIAVYNDRKDLLMYGPETSQTRGTQHAGEERIGIPRMLVGIAWAFAQAVAHEVKGTVRPNNHTGRG